jgi:predicted O-methyltransferase YrrM
MRRPKPSIKPYQLRELRSENADLRERIDRLQGELDQVAAERDTYLVGWPPGHFYSPIPAIEEIRREEARIFAARDNIPGVNLNLEGQLGLFRMLQPYYEEQPFTENKQDGFRYYFSNPNFTFGEAIILHCLLRHLKPRRIIEIGSGFSSCATLDTNEHFLGASATCTFIEPYPELLLSLLKKGDADKITLIERNLQDVDISVFSQLEAGDVLFIDSTHVAKINSDVNYILFEILPQLRSGVHVHFHDIGYPFEYPKEWIYEGRAWNEAYILRAFLQYNESFEIEFFNSCFAAFQGAEFAAKMPLCAMNPGTSIWLKKVV